MAYRIGVLDTLSVRVFQEPELSFEALAVDASGTINFPLVGEVQAVGKTPIELSDEIETRLGARFIRDPQVVVGVVSSAARRRRRRRSRRSRACFTCGPTTSPSD